MTFAKGARKSARGNRWGLGLLGLLLAAGGAAALATGLGLFGGAPAQSMLGSGPQTVGLGSPAWLPWVVAAVLVLVALLALRWLLVQYRVDSVKNLLLQREEGHGRTELSSNATQQAFQNAIADYPGVRKARAQMIDSSTDPRLRVDVTLEEDADVADVWSRVRGDALGDLRTALELDRLPAVVRLSMTAPAKNRSRVA